MSPVVGPREEYARGRIAALGSVAVSCPRRTRSSRGAGMILFSRSKTSVWAFGYNFPFSVPTQVSFVCRAIAPAFTAFCFLATLRPRCGACPRLVGSAAAGVIALLGKRLTLAYGAGGRGIGTPATTAPGRRPFRRAGFCLPAGVGSGLGESAAFGCGVGAPCCHCATAPGSPGAATVFAAVFQGAGLD